MATLIAGQATKERRLPEGYEERKAAFDAALLEPPTVVDRDELELRRLLGV